MEDQKISLPGENISPKILPLIFRGTLSGIIGGVTVVFMFEVIERLSWLISQGSAFTSKLYAFNTFVQHFVLDVVTMVMPVGLLIGISTGILAAIFGSHCPKLFGWLGLSWIGFITGLWLSGFGSKGGLPSGFLLEMSCITLTASGVAYQSTIQETRKGIPKAASWAYSVPASLSWVSLIFIMIYLYFKFWNYLRHLPS